MITAIQASVIYSARIHGPQDFKDISPIYDNFGNVNAAAQLATAGVPRSVIQAGFYAERAGYYAMPPRNNFSQFSGNNSVNVQAVNLGYDAAQSGSKFKTKKVPCPQGKN